MAAVSNTPTYSTEGVLYIGLYCIHIAPLAQEVCVDVASPVSTWERVDIL